MVGSEAVETGKQSERVRVNELNKALEHIDRALKTLAPNREGIEYLAAREDEEMFTRLADVVRAETLISKAVRFLNENFEREFGYKLDPKKLPSVKRGRRPALDIRAVIRMKPNASASRMAGATDVRCMPYSTKSLVVTGRRPLSFPP